MMMLDLLLLMVLIEQELSRSTLNLCLLVIVVELVGRLHRLHLVLRPMIQSLIHLYEQAYRFHRYVLCQL